MTKCAFSNLFGGVFGRDGVGFLLASALAGAKADVEKMTKSMCFLTGELLLRPLRAQGNNQGKRKNN